MLDGYWEALADFRWKTRQNGKKMKSGARGACADEGTVICIVPNWNVGGIDFVMRDAGLLMREGSTPF